jgi:hypothetical protein
MTSQQTTDTRIELLSRHANAIYVAIDAARADGFHLELKHGWALDLADADLTSTPIAGVQAGED